VAESRATAAILGRSGADVPRIGDAANFSFQPRIAHQLTEKKRGSRARSAAAAAFAWSRRGLPDVETDEGAASMRKPIPVVAGSSVRLRIVARLGAAIPPGSEASASGKRDGWA